jgi:hypothetical protein
MTAEAISMPPEAAGAREAKKSVTAAAAKAGNRQVASDQ